MCFHEVNQLQYICVLSLMNGTIRKMSFVYTTYMYFTTAHGKGQ